MIEAKAVAAIVTLAFDTLMVATAIWLIDRWERRGKTGSHPHG